MPEAVVVTAVMAPAHIRSIAKPGTDRGSPASNAAERPMVRPWSPVWVVAAIATSSMRSGGSSGWRRTSSRMQSTTRSSALVSAYIEPALPKGVRTPSTKTTSRDSRAMSKYYSSVTIAALEGGRRFGVVVRGVSASLGDGRCRDPRPIASPTQTTPMPSQTGSADRPPVGSLRAVAPERACYAGSVSKLLAPALRVGWMLLPSRYHQAVVVAKRDTDLGNAVLPQLVLAQLRRDLPEAQLHGAAAGLHLMVTFNASFSTLILRRSRSITV